MTDLILQSSWIEPLVYLEKENKKVKTHMASINPIFRNFQIAKV